MKLFTQNPFGYQIGYQQPHQAFDKKEQGYNAYLNRLCEIPATRGRHYFLALGIEPEIAEARVLHRQQHRTPRYSPEAVATRDAIKAMSGARHTFFAGAWLYDGLHEGAWQSAQAAAARL